MTQQKSQNAVFHLQKDPIIAQPIQKLEAPVPATEVNLYLNILDEAVITRLTKVKGIGKWTAEMILIFSLGDLGLRNAVATLYSVNRDDLKKIEEISKAWSPYRTLASRYLRKSLDNMPKIKEKVLF